MRGGRERLARLTVIVFASLNSTFAVFAVFNLSVSRIAIRFGPCCALRGRGVSVADYRHRLEVSGHRFTLACQTLGLTRENMRLFLCRSSDGPGVPKGRNVVATGASPWNESRDHASTNESPGPEGWSSWEMNKRLEHRRNQSCANGNRHNPKFSSVQVYPQWL